MSIPALTAEEMQNR